MPIPAFVLARRFQAKVGAQVDHAHIRVQQQFGLAHRGRVRQAQERNVDQVEWGLLYPHQGQRVGRGIYVGQGAAARTLRGAEHNLDLWVAPQYLQQLDARITRRSENPDFDHALRSE